MKRAPGLIWVLARDALRAEKPVGFDDEETATFDALESLQSSCLRDAPEIENSARAGPFVFFVFAADEAAEVETPGTYRSAAEVEGTKRNVEGCRPAIGGDFCGGGPEAVPARVND